MTNATNSEGTAGMVKVVTIEAEGLGECNLSYFKKSSVTDEGVQIFGICVEMQKNGDKNTETAETEMITESESLVDEMIATLAANTVTPCCLCEIVEDMIT